MMGTDKGGGKSSRARGRRESYSDTHTDGGYLFQANSVDMLVQNMTIDEKAETLGELLDFTCDKTNITAFKKMVAVTNLTGPHGFSNMCSIMIAMQEHTHEKRYNATRGSMIEKGQPDQHGAGRSGGAFDLPLSSRCYPTPPRCGVENSFG